MFEKSLVDLIRGMRGHKGQESEYIQNALKECRTEIRSQDMDVKATALLKLIYLEMFGYDMTWAAFNVLEVMSSGKHMQKRVGYLAAVQTFRPDTEVLMLAENLLKKDLSSPLIPTLSLPLVTLPHVVTSSLALSILTDLLPRLSHSQPYVRKKTIVTLYRLALVYPETLRVAWPKIKERLVDEHEDSSVTAACVNVVCELGWRRPHDFLPLAPRLFELLIDGGNNWMAIKIIKLFAVLTPLEPRLIKKLVRPLTNLIQSTTAMSLLYECISGIIQGGILDGADGSVNVDEIADLCISKLRGMIVLEGDPNLKYVALLAFNKIVSSHPALVAAQQDVILACLDDPDISIRLQALELASGMVGGDNLQNVVNRLMKQLANTPAKKNTNNIHDDSGDNGDNTDLEQKLVADKRDSQLPPLSDDYKQEVISRILDMCSHGSYVYINDFEWYIDVLVRVIPYLPATSSQQSNLGNRIGDQLQDISVRVKELRSESVKAAETLLLLSGRTTLFPAHGAGRDEVSRKAAWICGEYSEHLLAPYDVIDALVHESSAEFGPRTVSIFVQAIPKVFARIAVVANREWNVSRRSALSLMLARITTFLEKLSAHPSLEVQERSVEFLELLKLGSEALAAQAHDAAEAPLLLTHALPSLFEGHELNPVSAAAQRKVVAPEDLDLDTSINPDLSAILRSSQIGDDVDQNEEDAAFYTFYHERENTTTVQSVLQPGSQPVARTSRAADDEPVSYQAPDSPGTLARRRAERLARTKDDPFYIPGSGGGTPTQQMHEIIARENGQEELDLDSIPIIDLKIDHAQLSENHPVSGNGLVKKKKKAIRKFVVAADETIESGSGDTANSLPAEQQPSRSTSRSPMPRNQTVSRPAKNFLSVDSSGLGSFPLLEGPTADKTSQSEIERRMAEEAEMAVALKEIERKRLELAREEERARTQLAVGVKEEGVVVKRKKKKAKRTPDVEAEAPAAVGNGEGEMVKKKKKKKRAGPEETAAEIEPEAESGMLD